MERTIKDPTFNIYKDGGNVETKGKELKKEELLKLAKWKLLKKLSKRKISSMLKS